MVTAAFGTKVAVEQGWSPRTADLIVVPGGGFGRPNEPGVWPEINNGDLPRKLAAARRSGLTIASLCTGAIILAAAGLANGRPCTYEFAVPPSLAAADGTVRVRFENQSDPAYYDPSIADVWTRPLR